MPGICLVAGLARTRCSVFKEQLCSLGAPQDSSREFRGVKGLFHRIHFSWWLLPLFLERRETLAEYLAVSRNFFASACASLLFPALSSAERLYQRASDPSRAPAVFPVGLGPVPLERRESCSPQRGVSRKKSKKVLPPPGALAFPQYLDPVPEGLQPGRRGPCPFFGCPRIIVATLPSRDAPRGFLF